MEGRSHELLSPRSARAVPVSAALSRRAFAKSSGVGAGKDRKAAAPGTTSFSVGCGGKSVEKVALAVLGSMRAHGPPPDEYTFSATISALGKAGAWERALELRRGAGRDGVTLDRVGHNALVSACEKCAQWEHALEAMELMTSFKIAADGIIYSSLISSFGKAAQWQMAFSVLHKMP